MKAAAVESLADIMFDRLTGGADSISSTEVQSDIASSKTVAIECKNYADKRVAHHDCGEEPAVPTCEELNAMLEELSRVFLKYDVLVTGSHAETETILANNWQKMFDRAWRARAI